MKWIKNKIHWFFLGSVVFAATAIPVVDISIQTDSEAITLIETNQERIFVETGYYKAEKRDDIKWKEDYKVKKNKDIEIHIYDGPTGKGYQIIQHGEYGSIKAIGYGSEATHRTFEIIKTASST